MEKMNEQIENIVRVNSEASVMRASIGYLGLAERKSILAIRGSHNTFIQVTSAYANSSDSDSFDSDTDEDDEAVVGIVENEKYKYIGEVRRGKREGFGVCYFVNGDKYLGSWENDKMHGIGKLTTKNGKQYSGEYSENSINGFVEYVNGQGVIHHGLMRGCRFVPSEPVIIKNSQCEFKGLLKYKDGKLTGVGTFNYSNGSRYEGEVCDYSECGLGIYYRNDGYVFKGQNRERSFSGFCEVQCTDGSLAYGELRNNIRNGLCITISPEGGCYSVGNYTDDIRNGGFISITRESTKFEIWFFGFCGHTVGKKENIVVYVNTVYPEFKYLLKIKNNTIWALLTNGI
jgi:hypothetical protein